MKLFLGDCLEILPTLSENSVDMVLCDLPYGTTQCSWDSIIPFDPMWKELKRITKSNGCIVLFGQDKFTVKLISSNIKDHKYNLIWNKVLTSGYLNANKMPLRIHEDIIVFYNKQPTYNPQKTIGNKNHSVGSKSKPITNEAYGKHFYKTDHNKLGNLIGHFVQFWDDVKAESQCFQCLRAILTLFAAMRSLGLLGFIV